MLSPEYVTSMTPMLVRCDKGHEYETTWNNLRYYKCKTCYLSRPTLPKEHHLAKRRAWRQTPKGVAARQRESTSPRRKQTSLRCAKRRMAIDPVFRTVHYQRSRINKALRRGEKSAATVELLGCRPEQLKAHLESLFRPGMTWDNYGYYGWHVDHVRPLASFDLSDPAQQRQAFHYTNLQPLWRLENQLKGDKYL